jgi:hypothetical protein
MNEPENQQSDLQKEHRPVEPEPGRPEPGGPGIAQMFVSAAAAAFGVQSSKVRQRDFSSGNPIAFILVGLVFTLLFVLTILLVVFFVLS